MTKGMPGMIYILNGTEHDLEQLQLLIFCHIFGSCQILVLNDST
jgi:hypothetical protein